VIVAACAAPSPTPSATAAAAATPTATTPAATAQGSTAGTDSPTGIASPDPSFTHQPDVETPRPTLRPRPTPVEGELLPVTVDEFGFTVFPEEAGNYASFGATLTNPNTEWAVYRMLVQVNMFDASGAFLGGPELQVTVMPGQTTAVSGQVYGATTATRMVVGIPDDSTSYVPYSSLGDVVASDVAFTTDESTTRITGSLTSSLTSDQSALQLFAVYRDAAGAIIGGTVGAVESMPAGGTVPFEITDSPAPASTASVEIFWQLGGQLP